ncbi:dihydroorotate dehydrogenase [Scheffersomyces stipitis CBS 6054]|uniref:Dihydroorotate dehydrogenase (quinone), mitochondrial n=1 Tax=Scheffersomyces stipitis (strain ATCC 58785 / CBS 6054 / NBRC 10063 / NRRL Y-11545) TaxID=322104 RepID=A3LPT0_PICST|nr:dihydroorotate dehydrogenase [Scheffersomyces stipitis CBS 6054]ABN64550.2 dihydroorotate dehydrogenase [Scheffersomyces stipitis CBS 6054]
MKSFFSPRVLQTSRILAKRAAGHSSRPTVLKAGFLPTPVVLALGLTGAAVGGYYFFDARSAFHEYVLCPLIRTFTDGEQGHKLGILFMKLGVSPRLYNEYNTDQTDILGVNVFGTRLRTPIGLAAGLDKDGEAIEALFNSGFSYVEIGSITPLPQPGNPQPRFFRLPRDDAVINRYGFNSTGHFNVLANLKIRFNKLLNSFETSHSAEISPPSNAFRDGKLLGINLGKNKTGDEVEDYVKGVNRLGPYADVLVVNVSSPNTPGLRDLQNEKKLTHLLTSVVKERNVLGTNLLGKKPPVLVKVAPDLTEPEIESIANSAKDAKVDGIIISNTTIQRPAESMLTTDKELINQTGGLSGKPLKPFSLKALRILRKYTKDSDLVLIGCGGISSGKDALEFGKAGATFIQFYTSFAYKGPGLPAKIRDELADELKKEGKTWEQIIGEDDK